MKFFLKLVSFYPPTQSSKIEHENDEALKMVLEGFDSEDYQIPAFLSK